MINHIINRTCLYMWMLLVSTSSCMVTAEESKEESKFYLVEIKANEGKVYKSIFRISNEHMTFYYTAVLVDEEGKEETRILSDIMKIASHKEGVIISEEKDEQKFELNYKDLKVKVSAKEYEDTQPIKVVTNEEAAAALGTPWIVSKSTFKKIVQKGDPIEKHLVGMSVGISDHYSIKLWDGTRLDVYAPKGAVQSAYVEKDYGDKERIEWVIQSEP